MKTIKIILKGIRKILGFMLETGADIDMKLKVTDQGKFIPSHPGSDKGGIVL